MKFLFTALLLTGPFASFANTQACLEELDRIIGSSITLVETRSSDGFPLHLTLQNYNADLGARRATVDTVGRKGGGNQWRLVESMTTGRNRRITNCAIRSGSVQFNVLGRTISQRGGQWGDSEGNSFTVR